MDSQSRRLIPSKLKFVVLGFAALSLGPLAAAGQTLSPSLRAFLDWQQAPRPSAPAVSPSKHRLHSVGIVVPNDPFINAPTGQVPIQWGPQRIDAWSAWNLWQPKNAKPIVIAIVDTGVDGAHPDLKNMILRDAKGNVTGYNAITRTPGNAFDDESHGTHCAGIAAAETNNATGIAGIAGWTGAAGVSDTSHIKIMPVKVLDASGSGTEEDVADGIDWAVAHGANIISLSLGDTMPSNVIAQSLANAWTKGCVVCCAAGNEGNSNYFYPAYGPNILSVAATSNNYVDSLPFWSTYGSWVTVSAPGENVCSTLPGNNYNYKSGTSMACPHVVGLAALIWAQNPTLTNADIYRLVVSTVDKYPATYSPIAPGSGRINANSALLAVNAGLGSLRGIVTLSDCANASQPVTFRFRSNDGVMNFTSSASLTPSAPGAASGTFALNHVPAGAYTVSVKGTKWLQSNVPVTVSAAAPAALTVSLTGGDANNDNRVDVLDFGVLVNSYDSSQSDPNSDYDATADFNCDGLVDVLDFGILVNAYGLQGDE